MTLQPLAGGMRKTVPRAQAVFITGHAPARTLCRAADFVEVMAPIFSRGFLPQLRTLLEDSYTGQWANAAASYMTAPTRHVVHPGLHG